jgi:deazaflavin-dependent oxidoreductase (nitroreductase family)
MVGMAIVPKSVEIAVGLRVLSIWQAVYERSDGLVGGRLGRVRMLLLRTRGRRTGSIRTAALLYVGAGKGLAVIASKGGDDAQPAWYLNLRDDPEVEVQVGRRRWPARAREARGAERERLWRRAVAVWPQYERYQARTRRRIPVVVLEPSRSGRS